MSAATPTLQRSFGFYGPTYPPSITKKQCSRFDSESDFGVDTCGFMSTNQRISSNRIVLVAFVSVCLALTVCACRRGSNGNANANGNATLSKASSAEQAKALLDQGKDLDDHNQDEEAVKVLQRAIALQPDLAEAHLRLGMAFAALER